MWLNNIDTASNINQLIYLHVISYKENFVTTF